jgi:hypothetical protein
MDEDGNEWATNMPHHYGFINGFDGYDGDEVDCFIGPSMDSRVVFVVNQKGKDGKFDEHKCMLGFNTVDEAKDAYHAAYQPDWNGFDSMMTCSMENFKRWLRAGGASKGPFTEEFWHEAQGNPMTDESEEGEAVRLQRESEKAAQASIRERIGGDPNDPESPVLPK